MSVPGNQIPSGAQQAVLGSTAGIAPAHSHSLPGLNPSMQGNAMRASQDFTRRITHVEIRRVQNGFVLMGIDGEVNPASFQSMQTRVCMIANDAKELAALIENIINGSDLNWLPSVDIPITGLFSRKD